MRIKIRDLKYIRVETVSGIILGRIQDCVIDVELHQVVQYHVGSRFARSSQYMISPVQIVSVAADKMVVDDAVCKDAGGVLQSQSIVDLAGQQ
jgi:sporulation protein YlmC with PRC-barrel domain